MNQNVVATKLLDYFIKLEQYNFLDCDKDFITLDKFSSFFNNEPKVNDKGFILRSGDPFIGMKLFLEKSRKEVKGINLKKKKISLYYLPVHKEEVFRYFSNETDNSIDFNEIEGSPNSYLIQIQLDNMLEPFQDKPIKNAVVVSPILNFLLKKGKSLDDLENEIVNVITSLNESNEYKILGGNLTFDPTSKLPKEALNSIHKRYKRWNDLSENIQGVLSSYFETKHFNTQGIFHFSNDRNYKKNIKLTFNENVGINSFYLADLENIKARIRSNEIGNGLKSYLNVGGWKKLEVSNSRVDLFNNESLGVIKDILKKLPFSRWPSKYPLGLMQQVALNLIIEQSKDKNGFIFSVNGPPGTGKTTLLKDVFANILYRKVKFLRENNNLFTKKKLGMGEQDYYYSLDSKLKEYRILVTSNNNDAVENISKDLPKDDVLFNNEFKYFGYNKTNGTWGRISSALGKADNIKNFFIEANKELDDLINLSIDSELPFHTVEQNVKRNISTTQINDRFNHIDDKDWQKSEGQYINIDGNDLLNSDRSKMFRATMEEYSSFLITNKDKIKKNLSLAEEFLLKGRLKDNSEFVQAMFETIFLLTPIVSTTFASVQRFLQGLKTEDIGWLFIDEAGQATPQAAIGAIWRSKNIVVVGDPLQVPPVVTLSNKQLKLIAKDNVGITPNYDFFYILTRPEVSVQEFADLNNRYGGEMLDSNKNKKWLGCPLRVHRRCKNPMFQICNITTYQRKMIYGTDENWSKKIVNDPEYISQWYDIGGRSSGKGNHYIGEQGEKALEIAKVFLEKNPDQECYIISPFTSVIKGLLEKKELLEKKKLLEEKEDRFDLEKLEMGTVHKFQGKEAALVILVLGVDDNDRGPLNWASSTPNLLNVAVSRAKVHFVVIGNQETWGRLNFFETAFTKLKKVESIQSTKKEKDGKEILCTEMEMMNYRDFEEEIETSCTTEIVNYEDLEGEIELINRKGIDYFLESDAEDLITYRKLIRTNIEGSMDINIEGYSVKVKWQYDVTGSINDILDNVARNFIKLNKVVKQLEYQCSSILRLEEVTLDYKYGWKTIRINFYDNECEGENNFLNLKEEFKKNFIKKASEQDIHFSPSIELKIGSKSIDLIYKEFDNLSDKELLETIDEYPELYLEYLDNLVNERLSEINDESSESFFEEEEEEEEFDKCMDCEEAAGEYPYDGGGMLCDSCSSKDSTYQLCLQCGVFYDYGTLRGFCCDSCDCSDY